jgi:hypothetical protein
MVDLLWDDPLDQRVFGSATRRWEGKTEVVSGRMLLDGTVVSLVSNGSSPSGHFIPSGSR